LLDGASPQVTSGAPTDGGKKEGMERCTGAKKSKRKRGNCIKKKKENQNHKGGKGIEGGRKKVGRLFPYPRGGKKGVFEGHTLDKLADASVVRKRKKLERDSDQIKRVTGEAKSDENAE